MFYNSFLSFCSIRASLIRVNDFGKWHERGHVLPIQIAQTMICTTLCALLWWKTLIIILSSRTKGLLPSIIFSIRYKPSIYLNLIIHDDVWSVDSYSWKTAKNWTNCRRKERKRTWNTWIKALVQLKIKSLHQSLISKAKFQHFNDIPHVCKLF